MSLHSGSDGDSEDECEWMLGFVDDPLGATDLLRHRFPSKVGGRPAWLDPLRLPSPAQLACKATGSPLDFLLQVYAPPSDDDNPDAFHRTLFLFISPQGDQLVTPGAVRAFRCQLPRANPYYSSEPPPKGPSRPPALPEAERAAALAADPWRVAVHEQQDAPQSGGGGGGGGGGNGGGSSGSGSGSGSAAAEELRAQAVQHGEPAPEAGPRLYPELELIVGPEEREAEGSGGAGPGLQAEVAAAMRGYKQRTDQEGEYTEEELPGSLVDALEDAATEEQRHFAAFAARVAPEPGQCLRYCFEPGAAPLWPSLKGVPGPADVPPCERCGAARRFEMQVMPQLLNHLGTDPEDPASPDWGVIAVYSCGRSCAGAGGEESAYKEEFVWVQPSL